MSKEKLYQMMEKERLEFEKRYPGRIYSPEAEEELQETKKRFFKHLPPTEEE